MGALSVKFHHVAGGRVNVEFTICMCVFSSLTFLDHWHWCNWWVYWKEGKPSFEDVVLATFSLKSVLSKTKRQTDTLHLWFFDRSLRMLQQTGIFQNQVHMSGFQQAMFEKQRFGACAFGTGMAATTSAISATMQWGHPQMARRDG